MAIRALQCGGGRAMEFIPSIWFEPAGKFNGTDLYPVILEIVDFMDQDMKARNITLHNDLGDELPKVRGEKRTLKLVFSNLIGNAVKYKRKVGRSVSLLETMNHRL